MVIMRGSLGHLRFLRHRSDWHVDDSIVRHGRSGFSALQFLAMLAVNPDSTVSYAAFSHLVGFFAANYFDLMKLAEALSSRSGLQKDLAWIKDQFSKISRVPEGSKPGEDPQEMLERMETRATEFQNLVAAINRTNISVKDERGRSMTELLAERDALRARQSILTEAYQQATQKEDVYGRQELRYVPTMDIVGLRKRLEVVNTQLRELNMLVQRLNWEVDLAE